MKKQEIIEKVNAIMAEKAGIDARDVRPEDFYEELGGESHFFEALVGIEDEFGIDIPSEELLRTSTMQHLYDLVGRVIVETYGFELF